MTDEVAVTKKVDVDMNADVMVTVGRTIATSGDCEGTNSEPEVNVTVEGDEESVIGVAAANDVTKVDDGSAEAKLTVGGNA